ncbi:hypothetical protein EX895_004484 [Sporisorium graminicola]|uniref:Uncharacterized protein n=1 Tax=Sporisorium graminicola TaxID=280036 RepID=A0A4U7KPD9_9BASI|nr:hypothetical protein EX895_004484 [Sporisorium graminicola]TKY86335.1 hypothetical protein EX895_004484 [Sporisorium graminicola]
MNCIQNGNYAQLFEPNKACSPFGGIGHVSNCTELAQNCYQGYVASRPYNATDGAKNQVVYIGSVADNIAFGDCARRVLGQGGQYERGFISNIDCQLTTANATSNASTNAADTLKPGGKRGSIALVYLAALLAVYSFLPAAVAAPAPASAPASLHPARLTKVGHGSWGNITYTENSNAVKRQYDVCVSCDLLFWDGEDCKGSAYQFTALEEPIDGECGFEPGVFTCGDPALQGGQTLWVSSAAPGTTAESVITVDQTCPPTGPSALASIKPRGGCVYLGPVYGNEGLTCYPGGGSPYRKRQGSQCGGFITESQYESQSTVARVSDIIDCRTSVTDCTIANSQTFTSTIESSWSTTAGVDAFGFSVSATFGESYSESVATGVTGTYTIRAGSSGYLGAYAPMTVFQGRFTDCDDGSEEPGQVYAIQTGTIAYRVINTN